MRATVATLFCLFTLFLFSSASPAAEVAIDAAKDNTLFEEPDGLLSNGIGVWMFSGRVNGPEVRRALVAFDIAGNVPASATITAVTLQLNVSRVRNPSLTYSSALHRLTGDWGEGTSNSVIRGGGGGAPSTSNDATWIHSFYDQQFWQQNGGDFVAQPSATTDISSEGLVTWGSTAGLVADVQSWLDEPSGNFGWIIITDELSAASAARFDTHENLNQANRPVLLVEYEGTAVESTTWTAVKTLLR